MFVEELHLLVVPCLVFDELACSYILFTLLDDLVFLLVSLLVLSLQQLLEIFFESFDVLQVFGTQFTINDLDVSDRVYVSFFVDHLFVRESAHHMVDAVDSIDVRQERVTKTSTVTCSLDEPSDVCHSQLCLHSRLGFVRVN